MQRTCIHAYAHASRQMPRANKRARMRAQVWMLATADTEIFGAESNPGLTRREILDRCGHALCLPFSD